MRYVSRNNNSNQKHNGQSAYMKDQYEFWAAGVEFGNAQEENESSQRRSKDNKNLILETQVVDYSVRKCLLV